MARSASLSGTIATLSPFVPAKAGTRGCKLKSENWALLGRRGFADRGVDARQHLLGHQLHRAPAERGIDPIHAGIDDLAEIADLLSQRQQLIDHLVDAAVDHAVVEHV